MTEQAKCWTDRMYDALRARSKALSPENYPGGTPPDVAAWRAEVDRVYDALEYLVVRKVRNARALWTKAGAA